MGRIVSLWLPNWPITRLRLTTPPDAWPAEPVAIVETVEQRRQVVAVDGRGWAAGIRPGQKATDARAVLPALALVPADPAADARALARLVRWAGRYSPAVAPCPPDGLWLDITGCAHLWGGEDGLLADLAGRLERRGLPARIAVAGSFGAAWALAHYDRADRRILPDGTEHEALTPLPMAALRLGEDEVAALRRIGLTRIGELLAAPRAGLARRFGAGPLLRLDQALGRAEETVGFRRPPTPWFARLAFAEPIGTPEDLQRAIAALAADLCARLEARMMGAAQFIAAFHRVDGRCQTIAIRTALPVRDPARVGRLLADRLDRVDPGFGIEVATLRADRVAPVAGRQSGLSTLEGESAGIADLAGFVDIVGNRIGFDRIWRPAAVERHLPERCVAPRPPLAPDQGKPWPSSWIRPLRLLRRPEPIKAIAQIPDDPPTSFQWAGKTHRVRRADGPERIAYEWWRQARPQDRAEPDMIRDYYRVEDETGRRFWLYRAGLYREGETARWYLHGMFD
ncbi:DNA polymerase Y family protein [Inquilinus sp. Marseille-Q2685]|uniref:DNA polymerase Y family protein n=1 Tax=Inquilinus sp. Marseille-Q2685 TaxID=2866581 RepID=UPI001CE42D4F|nr:DNA polymerase Y family protein [Inquilinus sp. Marseille-Q2685]